eukprot:5370471-Pyramimonas_sp.AAC.1
MPMTPLRDLRTLWSVPRRHCAKYGNDNASTMSTTADKKVSALLMPSNHRGNQSMLHKALLMS